MMKRYLLPAIPMAAVMMLSGCIDNNYDLSDIDTTSKVSVNDLVIPVNLGTVTLNSVMDLDDTENISKEIYTGNIPELQGKEIYVFHQKGDFNSDPIHISTFHVGAPDDLEPAFVDVELYSQPSAAPRRKGAPASRQSAYEYDIKDVTTNFSYHINDVDDKVKSVREIQTPIVTFKTTIEVPTSFSNDMESIVVENLKVKFPKGLTMKNGQNAESSIGSYDHTTGIVTIPSVNVTNGRLSLVLTAQVLDLIAMDVSLANGHFDYNGSIEVLGGKLYMTPKAGVIPPSHFQMETNYVLSSFDIENFTGRVDYDIENLSFDNVKLNDLPDFLSQEGSKIRIANPQLYISFLNTCWKYQLGGETGLRITPFRKGVASPALVMDENITVGYNKGEGPYLFAVSPEGSALTPVSEYATATKELFSTFGDVLYGDGIPDEIQVEFTEPQVLGEAKNFPLRLPNAPESDWKISPVHGEYEFRAPLALADGSVIGYSGTEDDWGSDDLEDLHISTLQLTANVTSTVPLAVELTARLIDKDGNHIGKCEATRLDALADGQPIEIIITPADGEEDLTGINGIYYEVKAISDKDYPNPSDVPALSPEQTLNLTNLRAKVNGYYLYKDDNK